MNAPRPNPRRQAAWFSFLRWTAVLVVLFALTLIGYYLYVNVINRAPAEIYPVERGPAVSTVYGTFTITASNSLTLFAQNAGYLHTDPTLGSTQKSQGIAVKKDQLMATLVDENVERLVKQSQADYDSAVSREKNGPGSAGALKSAQDQVDAYAKLAPNAVPRVTREAAQNDVNRITIVVNNEKLELQRTKDAAENLLKTYQDQLTRTQIHAPFDGIVTAINFNDGAYVTPNQPVFTVATSDTYVSGLVNEEDVGELKIGMKAELHLYSSPGTNYTATISQIPPSPESTSSRYYVLLTVDNPPATPFLYGLTGDMLITVARKENALIVPARGVNIDQVLIVDNGVVEQRTVKVGFKSADYAEIVGGLSEGDQVIVEDQDAFHPGQRVRPVKVKSATAKK